MDTNMIGLMVAAILIASAIVAFSVYRWQQAARVGRVNEWVNKYLLARYGSVPTQLRVNCSDDSLWPVLVRFDTPVSGTRHGLQFACHGQQSTWGLLAETEEQREVRAE